MRRSGSGKSHFRNEARRRSFARECQILCGRREERRRVFEKTGSTADVYVSDAFGAVHRAHASTEGVTKHLKPAMAGFLLDREIKMLTQALDPTRPVATIIGGAKVSSKIGVLQHLLSRVDTDNYRRRHGFHLLQAPWAGGWQISGRR